MITTCGILIERSHSRCVARCSVIRLVARRSLPTHDFDFRLPSAIVPTMASPSKSEPILGGPATVVETACPLDCPDACSLAVTVQHGKLVTHRRRTEESRHRRLHLRQGPQVRRTRLRARSPALPGGPQRPQGRRQVQARDLGGCAGTRSQNDLRRRKREAGGESILPYWYGGSNGLLTQDNLDAQLWRRFGTSRLARTVCAAPTGAANMALYGKMPSVTYQDYPEAQLIILWGVNPSASGIHLIPYVREAQKRGARLVVIDPRSTPLARTADVHLAGQAGHRRRRRAGHPSVSLRGRIRGRGVSRGAHQQRRQAARAAASGRSSGRPTSRASTPRLIAARRGALRPQSRRR